MSLITEINLLSSLLNAEINLVSSILNALKFKLMQCMTKYLDSIASKSGKQLKQCLLHSSTKPQPVMEINWSQYQLMHSSGGVLSYGLGSTQLLQGECSRFMDSMNRRLRLQ